MTQPIGRNARCPCGSGKKYKQCCLKLAREQPLDGEFPNLDKLDSDDSVFPDAHAVFPDAHAVFPEAHAEHIEHGIVEAMKSSGVDPAIIYAFEQTGLMVSEENQHLISDKDLQSWESAIEEYRAKHPLSGLGKADESFCWSCDEALPIDAKRCLHCEASVADRPSPEDTAMMMELLQGMDPALLDEMKRIAMESSNGEEFVDRLMVGSCPVCESNDTGDCENDPEIDDPCVGRCFACSQLFCCDCDELFKTSAAAAAHNCPVWEELFNEDDDEEEIEL